MRAEFVEQRDGRVPFAELGRRVGLSAPAVAEHVGQTTTSIVHSAPVPRRPLPLEPPA
ncbi:MAG: hypothetical protein QOG35_3118 [Solirubrobacteraceae bacterium]|jgi:hypothetical protein|nr:hypothetical protein [Solirubrobacteraceae bacterium]